MSKPLTVNIEVKVEDLVDACIAALAEDGTVVPVVRCKDCKNYINHDKRCGYMNHGISAEDFCSHGERRE